MSALVDPVHERSVIYLASRYVNNHRKQLTITDDELVAVKLQERFQATLLRRVYCHR